MLETTNNIITEVPVLANLPVYAHNPADYELLKQIKGVLICNWNGAVKRVFMLKGNNALSKMTVADFDTIDKGCPGMFGINAEGNVICCLAAYYGCEEAINELERGQHIYLAPCSHT